MRLTVKEAAEINKTTCQAIYNALKKKLLKAHKNGRKFTINSTELEEYRKMKYSRMKTKVDGKLVFNNEKGFYSIRQASEKLDLHAPSLYYAVRCGYLKSKRVGASWVLYLPDVLDYKEKFVKKTNQE